MTVFVHDHTRDAKPRAAGVLFLLKGCSEPIMLLVRRGTWGDYPGYWSIPAGEIDPGETPEQCARREVREEVGYCYDGPLEQLSELDGFVTFVAIIPKPFTVRLNAESTDYQWTSVRPGMHPGLIRALQN